MYLTNRDIKWAVDTKRLIVRPRPEEMGAGWDETSIDLHLDHLREAKVWDVRLFSESEDARGSRAPELLIGTFNWGTFSEKYLVSPPDEGDVKRLEEAQQQAIKVLCRGHQVIVKPGGFLLWQTKECVGTERGNPEFICFVDGKSTRARTGIVVHLTAPNIHAGWNGNITLEIVNLGPFHIVLQENDVIAQLTVARVSSPPDLALKTSTSATAGQAHVTGKPADTPRSKETKGKKKP